MCRHFRQVATPRMNTLVLSWLRWEIHPRHRELVHAMIISQPNILQDKIPTKVVNTQVEARPGACGSRRLRALPSIANVLACFCKKKFSLRSTSFFSRLAFASAKKLAVLFIHETCDSGPIVLRRCEDIEPYWQLLISDAEAVEDRLSFPTSACHRDSDTLAMTPCSMIHRYTDIWTFSPTAGYQPPKLTFKHSHSLASSG